MHRIALVLAHIAVLVNGRRIRNPRSLQSVGVAPVAQSLAEETATSRANPLKGFKMLAAILLTLSPGVSASSHPVFTGFGSSGPLEQDRFSRLGPTISHGHGSQGRAELKHIAARNNHPDVVGRLRGGSTVGDVARNTKDRYLGLPVGTRAWFTTALLLSIITQTPLGLEPKDLALAASTFRQFQLWRLITAANVFGGPGETAWQLFLLTSYGSELEKQVGLRVFVRDVAVCGSVLTAFLHGAHVAQFTGKGLIAAVVMMTAMYNPDSDAGNLLAFLCVGSVVNWAWAGSCTPDDSNAVDSLVGWAVGFLTYMTKTHGPNLARKVQATIQRLPATAAPANASAANAPPAAEAAEAAPAAALEAGAGHIPMWQSTRENTTDWGGGW